ncbi:phosphatase PAP2 family protein [Saccharicrinis sp. 156]|uniref:phosphatase PAP2 family protein n=1 Tax=Saccharicrinis sp. 156 TaxID=3417574 RepID=UPI003D34780C
MRFNNRKTLRWVFACSTCSLILVATTFILPIEDIAVFQNSWVFFWIFITNTGGIIGISLLLLMFSIVLVWNKELNNKLLKVVRWFLLLSFVVGGTALVNEFLLKEQLKIYRPSILLLEREIGLNAEFFYAQENKSRRREYLNRYLSENNITEIEIDGKKVNNNTLKVWIKEAGYSFPSGHSVSAFLLATLLGYLLIIRLTTKYKWWIILLFFWAVTIASSRVILGVHSPVDVFLGALWGSVIGYAIILSNIFKRWFSVDETPMK